MQGIVEQADGALSVALNQAGKRLLVRPGEEVTVDEFEGSRLQLTAQEDGILCKTSLQDNKSTFTCKLRLNGSRPLSTGQLQDLETLINSLRVAINGRL